VSLDLCIFLEKRVGIIVALILFDLVIFILFMKTLPNISSRKPMAEKKGGWYLGEV